MVKVYKAKIDCQLRDGSGKIRSYQAGYVLTLPAEAPNPGKHWELIKGSEPAAVSVGAGFMQTEPVGPLVEGAVTTTDGAEEWIKAPTPVTPTGKPGPGRPKTNGAAK